MTKPDHDCHKLAAGCSDGYAYCCKCAASFRLVAELKPWFWRQALVVRRTLLGGLTGPHYKLGKPRNRP